jgi:hypothetical protein
MTAVVGWAKRQRAHLVLQALEGGHGATRLCPPYGTEFADSVFKQPKAFSRPDFVRVLQFRCPSPKRGRRESRAQAAPAAWRATRNKPTSSHHRFSQSHRLSPRDGVTVSFVLSPVSGVFCHRCLRDTSRKIDATVAAPGPHDFAVRSSAVILRARSTRHCCVHRIPARRAVTIARYVPRWAELESICH